MPTYEFVSPIYGTEYLSNRENVEYNINPQGMVEFFDALSDAFDSYIATEDLADYADRKSFYDKLESIKLFPKIDGKVVNCHAVVTTNDDLTKSEIEDLEDYLLGQYSDGIGEGFEQRAILNWTDIDDSVPYEDEETGEISYEEEEVEVDIYANLWISTPSYTTTITRIR